MSKGNFENAISSKGSSLFFLNSETLILEQHDLNVLLAHLRETAPLHPVTRELAEVVDLLRVATEKLELADQKYSLLRYPLAEWARQYENGHQNPLENECVQHCFSGFEANCLRASADTDRA